MRISKIKKNFEDYLRMFLFQKSVLPPILVPVGDLDHHLPVYVSTHLAAYTGVVIVIYSLFSI